MPLEASSAEFYSFYVFNTDSGVYLDAKQSCDKVKTVKMK